MKRTDFTFELPERLIAQQPAQAREDARLLLVNRGVGISGHHHVSDLPGLLGNLFPRGVVMVFNDSRVRKARLYARAENERPREFLLIEPVSDGQAPGVVWRAMTPGSRRIRAGTTLSFPGEIEAVVESVADGLVALRFSQPLVESYFADHGHVPLPPYIDREDAPADEERYQTVYAREPGSIAAPTAGLHFTSELLETLRHGGVQMEWVRLHVGIGTFLPVRVENILDHAMHEEQCEVPSDVAARLAQAREEDIPVLAVGTTTVRTLESAWDEEFNVIRPFRGKTDLFITPGYTFNVVDALFTNFHTPESTLLMLVSAFAGRETMLSAYREAVEREYRFFSYGDATLLY